MGQAIFVSATFIFLYYTIWTLVMPFVDTTHPVQNLFPAREWAIRIPVMILLLAAGIIGSFLGIVMVRSAKPRTVPQRR
ncbi:dolichol phosphate-mannose biosynthesis regulatory [Lipomyces orientalis]|uniref:Dolichol phosphate-mannose biosynthesis regulatory n=1 Tax=Lipomyces orientalis TaxID=1233043 RepID=A0ACC3TWI6_9ASCO